MANFSNEAERSILGSVLIDNRALAPAREILSPDDFYSEAHRVVYSAMLELDDNAQPINVASIAMKVGDRKSFADVGGVHYLMSCEQSLPSACNVPRFAEMVRADSMRRKLCSFGQRLEKIAQSPLDNADCQIASLSNELMDIADIDRASKAVSLSESMQRVCSAIVNHEQKRFVRSGFIDLDRMMTGFYAGTLSIIAARPAMGKTAFGLAIAANVAIDAKVPVLFFSLEMQADDLTTRIISSLAGVDGNAIKQESVSEAEIGRILDVVRDIDGAPLRIDETPALDIAVIKDRVKREVRSHGVGMVIVDYLQLAKCTSKNVGNREQEIAAISRGLKELAKDLSISVIALAQLNRALESRAEKRPLLSDLRESGSIEQDADNVLFIHREDYYTRGNTNEAEIIIAKQRSGPTGTVKLHWDGRYTRFSNLRNEYYDQNFR